MIKRKTIDKTILALLQDREWLTDKLINRRYSTSRLARELGTTRTTVEKYKTLHAIDVSISSAELSALTYSAKSDSEKKQTLERRKTTNKALYGGENTFQTHRTAIVSTMVERYGVKSPLQHPDIYAKRTQTMRNRYGVEHAMHNRDIYEKQLATIIARYGENPAKLERFQEKARQTNVERYGVICHTQQHLSPETIQRLDDPLWLAEQHHSQKKTLTQIAEELGCNITTVHRHCVDRGVKIQHYYESAQQRQLSDWIESLGIEVERNSRDIIEGELDIYIPSKKLAIEYCGIFWHCDAHRRMTPTYHMDKLVKCQEKGIRLITLFEDEWMYRQNIVKQKLLTILGQSDQPVVYARKCHIANSTKIQKTEFFDQNHIQGDGPGSITYHLEYDGNPVAMMTFIAQAGNKYVLNRYATSARVPGGFQKLLKYFQVNHQYAEILSFADLRWSEGGVYETSNFKLDKVLPPDYRYVIGTKTYHKFSFRRKKLETFLPNFDPALSEVQNMRNAEYYRLWNCGLLRYVMHP